MSEIKFVCMVPGLLCTRHSLSCDSDCTLFFLLLTFTLHSSLCGQAAQQISGIVAVMFPVFGLYLHSVGAFPAGQDKISVFDGLTGGLMKAETWDGTKYCSKGADAFMESLLGEFREDFPDIPLYLRGDGGFASPGIYEALEKRTVNHYDGGSGALPGTP